MCGRPHIVLKHGAEAVSEMATCQHDESLPLASRPSAHDGTRGSKNDGVGAAAYLACRLWMGDGPGRQNRTDIPRRTRAVFMIIDAGADNPPFGPVPIVRLTNRTCHEYRAAVRQIRRTAASSRVSK